MSNEQIEQRHRNLESLKALGVDPYPYAFEVTHHAADVTGDFDELESSGETVALAGRLRAIRDHGKSSFFTLQDKSGRVQLYVKLNVVGEDVYEQVKLLDIGDLVGVRGTMFRTRKGEITVEVTGFEFLAKCLRPLPDKWAGLKDTEIRYRQRYVDLIVTEETQQIFRVRADLVRAVRRFLDDRGFLEVETPILQPVYGGAFARPFTTHHEALGMPLYLRISNELYLKRLIVGGLERVYEIARDFRNEGIDRTHNPEFSMLEFYQAFADYEEMMTTTEAMVSQAIREATGGFEVEYEGQRVDFTPPFRRAGYFELLTEVTGMDLSTADEKAARHAAEQLGIDVEDKVGVGAVIEEIFGEKVEPMLKQPTFVTDFPRELSPLAKKHRKNPDVVERFELFVAGFELANAFSEQNDPAAQQEAFDRQSELRDAGDMEAQMTDTDYLRALQVGMPPTGGVGIGIDRLVMLATGAANIREVILFPQLRPEGGRESEEEAPENAVGDDTPAGNPA